MSSSPDCLAEFTLATVAKSTCPESGEYATDSPNAIHAEPGLHSPHDSVEHASSSESNRSTNWNCETIDAEYSEMGMHSFVSDAAE